MEGEVAEAELGRVSRHQINTAKQIGPRVTEQILDSWVESREHSSSDELSGSPFRNSEAFSKLFNIPMLQFPHL